MAYTPSWIYDSSCAPSRDEIARPSTDLQLYDQQGGLEGLAGEGDFVAASACSEDAVGRTATMEPEERTRNGNDGDLRLKEEEMRPRLRLHYARRSTCMANGEIDPLEAPSGTVARFSYYDDDASPHPGHCGRQDLQEIRQHVGQGHGLNRPKFETEERLLELRNGQQQQVPPQDSDINGHGTRDQQQRKDNSKRKRVDAGAGVSAGRRFVAWVLSKLGMRRRASRSRIGKPPSLDDDDDDTGRGALSGRASR